jgi:uncharacterized protein YfdQ (DUF2303 family)
MPNEKPIEINHKSEFEEAFKAGRRVETDKVSATIQRLDGGEPFLLVRYQDGRVEPKSLKEFQKQPHAISETVVFSDVDSFTRFVNEFKDKGTRIYGQATLERAYFRAIIDDHISGNHGADPGAAKAGDITHVARWGHHIAEYQFPSTPEWAEILANNRKAMKQLDFAHMVERLALNFKVPDGATMLELARNLEAKTEGDFKSSMDLDNGDRVLLFTQTTNAVAGARPEKIPIPSRLSLYVQPFIRGEHYEIEALFRYRVGNGQVTFEYELVKPHEFIDKAAEQVRAQIELDTLIKPLFGNA